MLQKNSAFYYFACCLLIVALVGCDDVDQKNSNDRFAKPSARIHEILNHRIDGPMHMVNQDIHFLFSLLQSKIGTPMAVSSDFNKTKVTFNLMNPTLRDVLELLRKHQTIDYEVKEINGDAIIFVCEYGKRPKLHFRFPKDRHFKPVKDHPILQKRIQGPIQFVNQDIGFLIAMMNSEFGVPIKKQFDYNRNVTFNLMNPTLQQILIASCLTNNLAYQVGTTENGVEVRLYDALDL